MKQGMSFWMGIYRCIKGVKHQCIIIPGPYDVRYNTPVRRFQKSREKGAKVMRVQRQCQGGF